MGLALLFLLNPLPALADENPYAQPGPYMIVAGLNAFQDFQDTPVDFDNTLGLAIRGGYRFGGFLAAEGAFEFLSGFDASVDFPPPVPPGVPNPAPITAEGGNFTANVKAYLPWWGRIQPYGLVGVGGMWGKLRTGWSTGTVCTPGYTGWWCSGTYSELGRGGSFLSRFGGGVEFWLSEQLGLMVDATYNIPTGTFKDLHYTSLTWGAVFKF
jgi:opacity protein-like surface antigen